MMPGLGLNAFLGGLGWRWRVIWKEVGGKYTNLDWGETQHGRRGNVNLGAQMELGCWSWDLDGGEMGPGFSWDAQLETCLGWHETRMGNYWGELDGGDTRHGWWWHKNLGTWIRVRQDLGGCALHNLRTCLRWFLGESEIEYLGPKWRWEVNCMDIRRKYMSLYWCGIQYRWRGHMNLGVWIEVISKPLDLYECEMGPGLSLDAPPETFIRWDVTGS